MKTILFQGDSITDAGRSRDNDWNRGLGYAHLVSSRLGRDFPGEYNFLNRGIGGNRIVDVYARIKADIINLKPDVMSILIGINDVWHEIGSNNGVATPKFEKIYSMLISEIKEALPDIKIIIMEPFVLEGPATAEKIDEFRKDAAEKAAVARKIAKRFHLPFLPLQEKFDELCKSAPATYWLGDGVHPSAFGHQLIADEWIKVFKRLKK